LLVNDGSSRVERLASSGDERTKGGRLAHGDVGEHLAVDFDLGRLQPRDEPRVRDVVLAARGVDADDPEAAELALPRAPVAVRVAERVHDLLVGRAQVPAARTGVPLRG